MPEKLLFFLYRQPALTRAEFCRRYLEEHAPLSLKHIAGLRRYVVNIVNDAQEKTPNACDAIAELGFDTIEDYMVPHRRYDAPESATPLRRTFGELVHHADGYRVAATVQRDYQRTWPDGEPSPGVKTIVPLRRKDGLTHEQFVDHWLHVHAPLALTHVLGIGRYVTNVIVEPLTPDAPAADGIVEVHYTEPRRFDSPEGEQVMLDDVASFLSPPSRNTTTEYILKS